MIEPRKKPGNSPEEIRAELGARLRARLPEIEQAIIKRVQQLAEPSGGEDPAYIAGLQRAVAAGVAYGLEGIEKGARASIPIPPETIEQARRAAREGVRLDTVLRRYTAGNKSLEDFILAEAATIVEELIIVEVIDFPSQALREILSEQGPHIDRVMKLVAAEYQEELERLTRSTAQKQAQRVALLLDNNSLISPLDFDYEFDAWHVGTILMGQNAAMTARAFSERLGYRILHVTRENEIAWAWFGSDRESDIVKLTKVLLDSAPAGLSVAIGEPRKGLDGWRLTHHEAKAAFQVMLYRPQRVIRCRDVILISAIVRDETLKMSLVETYLAPLDGKGDDAGSMLRKTLRAYFKADENIAAAASALNVQRNTVKRRLRRIEEMVGQTLDTCNAQFQVALAAEDLMT